MSLAGCRVPHLGASHSQLMRFSNLVQAAGKSHRFFSTLDEGDRSLPEEGHTPIEIKELMDDNGGSSCYPPTPIFIESGQ